MYRGLSGYARQLGTSLRKAASRCLRRRVLGYPTSRLCRTCRKMAYFVFAVGGPLAGPRPASVPGPRTTPPAHGVFFPTGTVIAADRAHNRSFSVLWRGSPYRTELSKGSRRRIHVEPRGATVRTYLLRRERTGPGPIPVGDSENHLGEHTKIPFSTGTYRAITADLTVPVGKYYRTCGEVLPYRSGNYTVLLGNDYRSRREVLPYWRGSITVPAGKFFGGFSCKSRRKSRELALRLSVLMH